MDVKQFQTDVDQALLSEKVNAMWNLLGNVNFDTTREEGNGTLRKQKVRFSNGSFEIVDGDTIDVAGASASGSESKKAFGYSISGAVVTVNAGYLVRGTRNPISVAGDSIELTADHQWIWIQYTIGATAALAGPSLTRPQSDDAVYRKALYQFRLVTGIASLEYDARTEPELPGAYA